MNDLIRERETLHGPPLAALLMKWLRGWHHPCGNVPCQPGCNQRGRWRIGKRLLRAMPPFWWHLIDPLVLAVAVVILWRIAR